MADRGKRRTSSLSSSPVAAKTAKQYVVAMAPDEFPPEVQDRLRQGELISHPRTRALWDQLDRDQKRAVLAPEEKVGKRYPLTSGDLARLCSLPSHRVRYWADKGILPCWHKGRRRLFEEPGVITAFALRGASQNNIQFYGEVMNEPVETLQEKLNILSSLLTGRVEDADPAQAKEITASLGSFPKP